MSFSSEWLEYEWNVRGDPAYFRVNREYSEDKPAGYDTLLYVAAAPNESGALFFTASEIRRLLRVEKKLVKTLSSAIYAGYIHLDALRQYYFYVSDESEAIEQTNKLADKENKLNITADTTNEPDWLTYYALLLPDAAKYQTVYNAQLIERQRQAGDALEKVRRVTFFICFPSDLQRQLFIADARQAGFAVGDALFQQELALSHVQTLYYISSLDKRDIDNLTTKCILTSAPYDGEFLRWTCPRMSRKSPLA